MEQNIQPSENSAEIKLDSEGEPINSNPKKHLNRRVLLLIIITILLVIAGSVYFVFLNKEGDSQPALEENVEVVKDEEVVETEIDRKLDTDQDGLPDYLEKILGTDENSPDTDGDTYSDFEEIKNGYNPLNREKYIEEELEATKELIKGEDEGLFKKIFFIENVIWKNYKNEKYAFEIKYPENYSIIEKEIPVSVFYEGTKVGGLYHVVFIDSEQAKDYEFKMTSTEHDKSIIVTIYENGNNYTLEQWLEEYQKNHQTKAGLSFSVSQNEEEKEVIIDGIKGLKGDFGCCKWFYQHSVFLKNGNYIYQIGGSWLDHETFFYTDEEVFDQMISNFIFINN